MNGSLNDLHLVSLFSIKFSVKSKSLSCNHLNRNSQEVKSGNHFLRFVDVLLLIRMSLSEKSVTSASNELHWTLRNRRRPLSKLCNKVWNIENLTSKERVAGMKEVNWGLMKDIV